ncbi:unnamed protein product [Moneuplotes crassus]|uniref:Uncharacterized protein n=1 Tax=Euplotes crassus TaxID=5936 RepID=A0AAD1U7T9_EUPCR|nr:unnamed protein product [Moneuplotes crassus]
MLEQIFLNVNGRRISLQNESLKVFDNAKIPNFDIMGLGSTSSIEEFGGIPDYQPSHPSIFSNDYNTIYKHQDHNISCQGLQSNLKQQLYTRSGHVGAEHNKSVLNDPGYSRLVRKNQNHFSKWRHSSNARNRSFENGSRNSKNSVFPLNNTKKATNQLLNCLFQTSDNKNQPAADTFSDLDSVFPMKMRSFSKEQVVLPRNEKMRHCTPKKSKDIKIFRKAHFIKRQKAALNKLKPKRVKPKQADLPAVNVKQITFHSGNNCNNYGDNSQSSDKDRDIKVKGLDSNPYDSKQKPYKRVLNKSYSNNCISRRTRLTKNLELSQSQAKHNYIVTGDSKRKISASPYSNFFKINSLNYATPQDHKENGGSAQTSKLVSKRENLSSNQNSDSDNFKIPTPTFNSALKLKPGLISSEASPSNNATKLRNDSTATLHSQSTLERDDRIFDHSQIYQPVLPMKIQLSFKRKSRLHQVLPKNPSHESPWNRKSLLAKMAATRLLNNRQFVIKKEQF